MPACKRLDAIQSRKQSYINSHSLPPCSTMEADRAGDERVRTRPILNPKREEEVRVAGAFM